MSALRGVLMIVSVTGTTLCGILFAVDSIHAGFWPALYVPGGLFLGCIVAVLADVEFKAIEAEENKGSDFPQ